MSSIDTFNTNTHGMDSSVVQSSVIKSLAHSMGFFACGIAKAAPVDEVIALKYRQWLEKGEEASMAYMANYLEKRLNPCLLVPGVRSIISLPQLCTAQQIPKGNTK